MAVPRRSPAIRSFLLAECWRKLGICTVRRCTGLPPLLSSCLDLSPPEPIFFLLVRGRGEVWYQGEGPEEGREGIREGVAGDNGETVKCHEQASVSPSEMFDLPKTSIENVALLEGIGYIEGVGMADKPLGSSLGTGFPRSLFAFPFRRSLQS